MNSSKGPRALLFALGIAAIAGFVGWRVYNKNVVSPPGDASPARADTVARASSPTPQLSDSEYKAHLQQYGVLVQLRDHSTDTGSFYFVQLSDSSQNLQQLGFIPTATLIDASSRFTVVGSSKGAALTSVASTQLVASRLHEAEQACTMEVPVPLRFGRATPAWIIGLAADGGEGFAPNISDSTAATTDSAGMRDALHIANALPDSARAAFENDSVLGRGPFTLAGFFHFTADGVEIIVVDARRTVQHRITEDGKPRVISVLEQRPFIAERAASNASAPYAVKWEHQGGGPDDDANIMVPTVVLRLGAHRLLTVYLSGEYEDGNGGVFVSRTADSSWREVAEWVGGC